MSEKNRDTLRVIIEREAVAWAVEEVSPGRIDTINILNASFEGMSLAASRLAPAPEMLVIDGNRWRSTLTLPAVCVVGGDGLYAHVAAASVLAKTWRDEKMRALAARYPHYGWEHNKGYPTEQHRRAIADHGLTPWHRISFRCLAEPELF